MMLRYTIHIAAAGIEMPYTCDASDLVDRKLPIALSTSNK